MNTLTFCALSLGVWFSALALFLFFYGQGESS